MAELYAMYNCLILIRSHTSTRWHVVRRCEFIFLHVFVLHTYYVTLSHIKSDEDLVVSTRFPNLEQLTAGKKNVSFLLLLINLEVIMFYSDPSAYEVQLFWRWRAFFSLIVVPWCFRMDLCLYCSTSASLMMKCWFKTYVSNVEYVRTSNFQRYLRSVH